MQTTSHSNKDIVDLLVVGGGINGVGVAADAAGRNLSVMLCERDDLACATSSSSSKLIHGGLRYLEHYEFRLVREALAEREVLLKKAPHIIRPLRFCLPHAPHLRPAWMIRFGLFLYDHLSRRVTLEGSRSIDFDDHSPLVTEFTRGFEYSDAWVDDARLVVLNALAARQAGASIRTRTECIAAQRIDGLWQVVLRNTVSGAEETVTARCLVNAAGPWVCQLYDKALPINSPNQIRLVKGSHIIVPKLYDDTRAFILQNEDNRVVFVIPYQQQFSLVGTTDTEFQGNPADARISAEETDYLIAVINRYFKRKITAGDIVTTFAGVRPLLDDEADSPQAVTRDYKLILDAQPQSAPLLSVFGGKLTTYRKLAEACVNRLVPFFPHAGSPWTGGSVLPGGDFAQIDQLIDQLQQEYDWLPHSLVTRFARSYGTLTHVLLEGVSSLKQMGIHFGADLYQREVDYLTQHEWAQTAEDILYRRTKAGLELTEPQQQYLQQFIAGSV